MSILLLIILLLLFFGCFTQSDRWGNGPSISLGTLFLIFLILWICGVI